MKEVKKPACKCATGRCSSCEFCLRSTAQFFDARILLLRQEVPAGFKWVSSDKSMQISWGSQVSFSGGWDIWIKTQSTVERYLYVPCSLLVSAANHVEDFVKQAQEWKRMGMPPLPELEFDQEESLSEAS